MSETKVFTKDITTEEKGENLKKFSVWKEKCKKQLLVTISIPNGNVAHFREYDGTLMIGFGDKDGFELDKDALAIDKKDLPEIIAFLQTCLMSE